jgi:hypothetical protein
MAGVGLTLHPDKTRVVVDMNPPGNHFDFPASSHCGETRQPLWNDEVVGTLGREFRGIGDEGGVLDSHGFPDLSQQPPPQPDLPFFRRFMRKMKMASVMVTMAAAA